MYLVWDANVTVVILGHSLVHMWCMHMTVTPYMQCVHLTVTPYM